MREVYLDDDDDEGPDWHMSWRTPDADGDDRPTFARLLAVHLGDGLGDLVLPASTLSMVRRQVIGVAEHRARLLEARQHLKRGLLLYGAPGGRQDTHAFATWSSRLSDVTVVELYGDSLRLIAMACSVARTLQPALIAAEAASGAPLEVTAEHLDAALDELLDTRNAMTRTLLGGSR